MSTTKWIRGTAYAMTLGLLLAAKVGVAATGTWSNDADGNWSTGPWTGSTPGGTAGDTANLNNGNFSLTANRTVTLNQNVKLGTLLLREGSSQQSSDFNWILAQGGANTLTFDNSGSTANLTLGVNSGNCGYFGSNNQINVPVSLNDNLLIQMNGYIPGTPRSTLYVNQAISDGVNGAKSVTVSGVNNGYGYVYLAVSNSFSGGLTLQNIAYVRLTAVGAAGSGSIAIGTNSKLFVDAGQVLNSTISGAGILELANSQALTLGGANSAWTGQLLYNATPGTVTLSHSNALSAAQIFLNNTTATITNSTGGALVINQVANTLGGSALTLNGGDITVNSVNAASSVVTTLTLNNNTTIGSLTAGDVTKNGTGKLALTGTVTLGSSSTALTISSGTLELGNGINFTQGQLNLADGVTVQAGAGGAASSRTVDFRSSPTVTVAGSNPLTFGGSIAFFNPNGGATTLNVADGAGLLTFSGTVGNSFINNNERLAKTGPGTLVLSGSNTYRQRTEIANGALRATDGVGLSTSSLLRLSGGVLESSGTFTRTLIANPAASATPASSFTWTSSGGFAAYGAALTVNINGGGADNLIWNSTAGFLTTGYGLKFGSSNANDTVTFQDNIDLNGAVRTIQVDDNPSTNSDVALISGVISGSAGSGLTKTGNGTLILGATNTYPGATTVSSGTLLVTGATTNSAVTVASNAVLGGTGFLGRVTVNGGGVLSANGTNTIGALSVTNLTLAENAVIYWNYDATVPSADLITVTGALTLPTNATVYVSGTGTLPSGGQMFSANSLSGASTLSGWTITGPGAKPTSHAVRSGTTVSLVTSRGAIVIIQ